MRLLAMVLPKIKSLSRCFLAALKDNTIRIVRAIPAEMLLNAVDNTVDRMQRVVQKNGGHIECAK